MSVNVVRTADAEAVRWGSAGVIRFLGTAASTEGMFSVVELTEAPGGAAPLHVHHAEAEAFYILEGELELTCGDETLRATGGDFVYTPKDVPHTYVVVGDRAARVLLLFSRLGFERFFAEGGTPLDAPPAGPPDPDAMQRLLAKYDLEVLEGHGH